MVSRSVGEGSPQSSGMRLMVSGKANYDIVRMARLLGAARSGYYDWVKAQPNKATPVRELPGALRLALGFGSSTRPPPRSRGSFGSPRPWLMPGSRCTARRWQSRCVGNAKQHQPEHEPRPKSSRQPRERMYARLAGNLRPSPWTRLGLTGVAQVTQARPHRAWVRRTPSATTSTGRGRASVHFMPSSSP